jgi:hypothetical protein
LGPPKVDVSTIDILPALTAALKTGAGSPLRDHHGAPRMRVIRNVLARNVSLISAMLIKMDPILPLKHIFFHIIHHYPPPSFAPHSDISTPAMFTLQFCLDPPLHTIMENDRKSHCTHSVV